MMNETINGNHFYMIGGTFYHLWWEKQFVSKYHSNTPLYIILELGSFTVQPLFCWLKSAPTSVDVFTATVPQWEYIEH